MISVASPNFIGNEKKYVKDCMETTWISSAGKFVSDFEDKFSEYLEIKYAVSCCNGTAALHLPLMALGVEPGDEVILPSLTYIATANCVSYCGAKPVFADCRKDTWNIDPEDVKRKITPKTRGIIAVHLYGNPCDMDPIMEIAKKYHLFVIEDAAESHGATYKGRKVGTIGDVGSFSFFGNKIITTGEGGMVVTNNDAMDRHMRILKGQGQDPERRYWFIEKGYNYRMTNIEAAIGLAQLECIDEHIASKRRVAGWYMKELDGLNEYMSFQKVIGGVESVWWMFSICLTKNSAVTRDELMEKLAGDGIETRPVFYPMHIMPVYRDEEARCPVSEEVASNGINLPTHAKLTIDDVRYISDKIKKYVIR